MESKSEAFCYKFCKLAILKYKIHTQVHSTHGLNEESERSIGVSGRFLVRYEMHTNKNRQTI